MLTDVSSHASWPGNNAIDVKKRIADETVFT
jgi:hypothetical protein